MITKLEELLKILKGNPEGVSQDDIDSLTDAVYAGGIEQINDQIVTINTTLEEGEEQINIDQLNLQLLKEAIERFKKLSN